MNTNSTDKPNYKCAAYHAMSEPWRIVGDVKAGTLHIRKQAKRYLPKFPAEHKDDYEDRLATATLFNAYNRTVNGLVGMVFKKNPILSKDVPQRIREHAENIDLAGTHLDVFCRQVLEDAFEGHSFILVDMQQALAPGATLADEQNAGRRPYWIRYRACQAFNFMPIEIKGRVEIGQITFEEEISERAGRYGAKAVKQYRTFWLEEFTEDGSGEKKHRVLWELKKLRQEQGQERTFEDAGSGVVKGFDRIPVAVVYGKRTGFLQSQPVLLDLALINIKYYQKRSDYDSSLHKAGFPIPVFIGRDTKNKTLAVGSGFGIDIPMNGDAKYMEPMGNSLEEARNDLKDLREEMASLGLSVVAARPDGGESRTATETVIDFAQESSELETMARSEADAVEQCLQFHARYMGEKSGGSVELGAHLRRLALTAQQVQAYSQMVAETQLTIETLWSILKRGDALPEDFDPVTEKRNLFGDAADDPAIVRDVLSDTTRQPAPQKQPAQPPETPPATEKGAKKDEGKEGGGNG
jgi:hypothetical protein